MALVSLSVVVAACSPSPSPSPDSGEPPTLDAGTELPDAGADAGSDLPDAGPGLDGGVLVQTTTGPVLGQAGALATSFLGIPYAAPPVGELRWKPPAPALRWTTPRLATAFGAICPQDAAAGVPQSGTESEDCLTLNVWTPRPVSTARLPVMVFIHGGGFKNGSGTGPLYANSTLPGRDVVLVSLEYRLGNLGFLAHPLLTAESPHASSGNYGLLDQVAALQWVRDNIAAFGGDPSNVTIFGESAGSLSVCTHLFSPLSRGLFHRALGESGSCTLNQNTLARAQTLGQGFATTTACSTLACLRGLTVEQVTAVPSAPDTDFGAGINSPTIDGWVLPEAPAIALAAGHLNPVEAYLGGVNRDEATLFTIGRKIDTEAQLKTVIGAVFPNHVDDVLAAYPPLSADYPTYKSVYDGLATDLLFVCPTKQLVSGLAAAGVRSYLYHFEKVPPGRLGMMLGATHGAELPFVFGGTGLTAASLAISNQMQTWWTGFAKSGEPGDGWGPFDASTGPYMNIDDSWGMMSQLRSTQCQAIAQWLTSP